MSDEIRPGEPLEQAIAHLRQAVPILPGLAERVAAHPPRSRAIPMLVLATGAIAATILFVGVARRSHVGTPVEFTIAAPADASVELVGDFTDWQVNRVQLRREDAGLWHATVNLRPGRYRFAYVIDHDQWRADAHAAEAPDDYGRPTSVLTVVDH